MTEIKIWESNLQNRCKYINTIDELLNYLKEKKSVNFIIQEKFTPGNPIKTNLDNIVNKQNISLTYTDNEHQVNILDDIFSTTIIINPEFYNKHKKEIQKLCKTITYEKLRNKINYLEIPDFLISDELINTIITNENFITCKINFLTIDNIDLTQEQIKLLQSNHLNIKFNNKQISDNKGIKYHHYHELKSLKELSINTDINDIEIDNFKELNNECIVTFNNPNKNEEHEYIQNLTKILNKLKEHNKTYKIKIEINNRELLKQSGILNIQNIDLIISNEYHNYSKEEYLSEESQLDKLIEPIKNANLSPYEKYLAVYNIVKQFKPYKENEENKDESRYIRYILNNEYMVCVGYSTLLNTLLNKVGIPSQKISVGIDVSYDQGFTQEEKTTEITGHARNLIKIDDDKYNIHGIYIADATWDNDMKHDLYNNASMTFDRKKEARRLESLTKEDLLLDFHDINDFNIKINHYLKRRVNYYQKQYSKKDKRKNILNSYENIYQDILKILCDLDYKKFQELKEKYQNIIEENQNNFPKLEQIYADFLTDYALYIIPLSNQKIDKSTLLEAALNTKKELNNYNKEQLENLKNEITNINDLYEQYSFPYTYDPNNQTPNYLESIPSKSK